MSLALAQCGILTPPSGALSGFYLTKVADATGTLTVTWPTVAAGDLAILWNYARYAPAEVVPSGFTKVFGALEAGYSCRCVMSYKICGGSEIGSFAGMTDEPVFGFNDPIPYMSLLILRGSSPIVTAAPSTFNGQVTTGNPSAQNVAASGGTPPLVVVAGYGASGAVSPRTFSPSPDGEISPGAQSHLGWKIYNSSPSNTTVDMDDEGTGNALSSGYIAVADS